MSPHLVVWHTRSNCVGFNFQVALDPEEEDEKQERRRGGGTGCFISVILHCVIRNSSISKIRVLPLGLCPKLGLRKFRRGKSIVLSTNSSTVERIGVNAAGVAEVATPQYLTCRGRPVLTTPNILTSVYFWFVYKVYHTTTIHGTNES